MRPAYLTRAAHPRSWPSDPHRSVAPLPLQLHPRTSRNGPLEISPARAARRPAHGDVPGLSISRLLMVGAPMRTGSGSNTSATSLLHRQQSTGLTRLFYGVLAALGSGQ